MAIVLLADGYTLSSSNFGKIMPEGVALSGGVLLAFLPAAGLPPSRLVPFLGPVMPPERTERRSIWQNGRRPATRWSDLTIVAEMKTICDEFEAYVP